MHRPFYDAHRRSAPWRSPEGIYCAPLNCITDVREITLSDAELCQTRYQCLRHTRRLKYSCSGSPDRFSRGNTAIESIFGASPPPTEPRGSALLSARLPRLHPPPTSIARSSFPALRERCPDTERSQPFQVHPHLTGRLVTVIWLFVQGLNNDALQTWRNLLIVGTRWFGWLMDDGIRQRRRERMLKRPTTCGHFIEHDAEGKEVTPMIRPFLPVTPPATCKEGFPQRRALASRLRWWLHH